MSSGSDRQEDSDAGSTVSGVASSAEVQMDSEVDGISILSDTDSSMSVAASEDDDEDDDDDERTGNESETLARTTLSQETTLTDRPYSLRARRQRSLSGSTAEKDYGKTASEQKPPDKSRGEADSCTDQAAQESNQQTNRNGAIPTQTAVESFQVKDLTVSAMMTAQALATTRHADQYQAQLGNSSEIKMTALPAHFQSLSTAHSSPLTRNRAAKLRASLAIQNQLGCAPAVPSLPHGVQPHRLPVPSSVTTPGPFFTGAVPAVRPVDPSSHPYIVSPFLQRSPMDMKATTLPLNTTRFINSPSYPHPPSFNLEDVSQFWSPNPPDMASLPLFPTTSHPAPFQTSFPSPHSLPHTPVSIPNISVHGLTPASSITQQHISNVVIPPTAVAPPTCTKTSKPAALTSSSISAAAHSTTQPTSRSSRRSHGKSKGSHRDSGCMSKAERRRNKASIRERKRVVSLNEAFLNLKRAMPFVPPDTKLSKIKTLRFAIRYVKRLMEMLADSGDKSGSMAPLSHGAGTGGDARLDPMFEPNFGGYEPFDLGFDLDFNTPSHPSLPDVPISINDSDLDN